MISTYQLDGTLDINVSLDTLTSVPHPTNPGFVIYFVETPTTDPDTVSDPDTEALALTDTGTGGGIISYFDIGGGTTGIVAIGGAASGATSTNIPGTLAESIQFDIFGNRVDMDLSVGDSIVCMCSGTLVLCGDVEVRVENLRSGDLVQTADHGLQPIRWIGSKKSISLI